MALAGPGVVTRQQRRARARAARKRGVLAVGAMLAAGTASAATITVNSLADTTVSGDAQCTLREAITNANGNADTTGGDCAAGSGLDTIVFQSGLTGTITLGGTELPVITDSVAINGPGSAVLSISGNSLSRIFEIDSPATTPIDVDINNLTLTLGSDCCGGAINDDSENLTLDHVVITGSVAAGEGGGLAFSDYYGATLTISNSTISGNTAGYDGGGISIFYAYGAISITNSTISGNTATKLTGGGIYVDYLGAPMSISGSTISGNSAGYNGGGVYASEMASPLTISTSTISGNTAGVTTFGSGGGIDIVYTYSTVYLHNDTIGGPNLADQNKAGFEGGGVNAILGGGYLKMVGTIVMNNTAGNAPAVPGDGGGVRITTGDSPNPSTALIADCVITGNVADPNDASPTPLAGTDSVDRGYGGGVYLDGYYLSTTVRRTTISGNTAFVGGGVYMFQAQAAFENVTIANNAAKSPIGTGYGGGVQLESGYTSATFNETTIVGNTAQSGAGGIGNAVGDVTLSNSIVANNTAPDISSSGGTVTATYTLIKDPSGATITDGTGDITGTDPNLGPLGDNGSIVLAGVPSAQLHPQTEVPNSGSPVINTGNPTPPAEPTDERGLARVVAGRVDMGAVEVQPTISITAPAPTAEGNSGTTPFVFTVTLSATSSQTVTVNYATANGTAVAPSDYTAAASTLTFAPGETSKLVTINVNGDLVPEANETFSVNLSSPSVNATIATGTATATIVNDDVPVLSIAPPPATNEGNSGTTPFVFTVTLTPASTQVVTVNFASADGTAVAPGDYTAVSNTLTFNPGETSKPITVNVNGDIVSEPNETFNVNLSSPSNATIGSGTATATILNDDGTPALSIAPPAATSEGNTGTTPFVFTVTLAPPSSQTVTVNYATSNGTAAAPGDFTAASGTLTFTPGQTTQPITVNVVGDTVCEPDETFSVNLSSPANATISNGTATATILNDDPCATDLSITKTASPGPYFATQMITYTLTVSNAGPTAASAVTVTDILPANTTFVSATPSQGSCSGTTTVTCTLGSLAVGSNATIALQVTPTAAGALSNTATVSAGAQTDTNPANNSATSAVTVAAAGAIPTLSQWAEIFLALMLAFLGLFKMKNE